MTTTPDTRFTVRILGTNRAARMVLRGRPNHGYIRDRGRTISGYVDYALGPQAPIFVALPHHRLQLMQER